MKEPNKNKDLLWLVAILKKKKKKKHLATFEVEFTTVNMLQFNSLTCSFLIKSSAW